VLTADTAAVKLALVELAGTTTDAGTVTAVLPLERVTVVPLPGAAELKVTMQSSDPDPVIVALLQVREPIED